MIKERERGGNRWTANAKEGGFVSEGPALGSGSGGEKKKDGGGRRKHDASIITPRPRGERKRHVVHRRWSKNTSAICARLLFALCPLSPSLTFGCQSPPPPPLPFLIWRGPCRLKSEGSHFGRRLLLWKEEKVAKGRKKRGNRAKRRNMRQIDREGKGERERDLSSVVFRHHFS